MKYQTIEGEPLSREEFKKYVFEVLKLAKENEKFNHYEFLFELREMCELTSAEFTEIVKELNQDIQSEIKSIKETH